MSCALDESQAHWGVSSGLNQVRAVIASTLDGWELRLRGVRQLLLQKDELWFPFLTQSKLGWQAGSQWASRVIAYILQTLFVSSIPSIQSFDIFLTCTGYRHFGEHF